MKIRRAMLEDCGLIWLWANDPVVRGGSFNTELIPWREHIEWFRQRLDDANCLFYIVSDDNDMPKAQVRFDIDPDTFEAAISVSINYLFRGKGCGAKIIKLASDESKLPVIEAKIKPDNTASLKAFAKAGYKEIGTTEFKGQKAVVMVLDKTNESW